MKKILFAFLLLIIIGSSFWLYWKQLSIEEQWLLFNKKVASNYAKELLAAQHIPKTPDDLIDMHIVTKNGMVTFDPHDQDRFFVLAFSPNREPEPLQESGRMTTWKKLHKDWYTLNLNKSKQ